MTYPSIEITSTPIDIVAALSLPDGNFTVQNIGTTTLTFAQKDVATDADTLIRDQGHLLSPLFSVSVSEVRIEVDSDFTYVWCTDDPSGRIVVSDAP